MALYETVFIARPDLTADDVDAVAEKFSKIIAEKKGKVVSKEYWGLRPLAYRINKSTRGHYILLNINSEYPAIAELSRVMRYNEDIIRSAIFKVEAHDIESSLFVAPSAKEYKPSKVQTTKKEPSKLDQILDQIQFEA